MKKQSLKLFAAALALGVFAILATANPAKAQDILKFEVPFEFNVGGEKMSAGNYDLKKINTSRYLLRNTETKEKMIVVFGTDIAKKGETKAESLVFNRYGETYFLRQLFVNSNQPGKEILESKQERWIRKSESETQLAKNQTKVGIAAISSAQ